jgi:ATP-dependent Clp protease ATP-binding subunit ClpC
VVLLDEIEKAHSDVYNILLQVFDEGRLTDGKGRVVNFTNTIIIATSNLGSDIIQENLRRTGPNKKTYQQLKEALLNVLRNAFRPEFLNRIDEIIVFHSLTQEQVKEITKLQLEKVRRMASGQGLELEFDESLIEHLSDVGYIPEYGARELRRRIQTEVETVLARGMLKGDVKDGDRVQLKYSESDGVTFEKIGEAKPPEMALQASGAEPRKSSRRQGSRN